MFFNDTFNGVGLLLKAGEFGLRPLLSQPRAALIFADRSRYLHATCMINEKNH